MAPLLDSFTILASLAICIRAANKAVLARRADADSTKYGKEAQRRQGGFVIGSKRIQCAGID